MINEKTKIAYIKEHADFIDDLVQHYDEFTTSDLQGVIEAKCFKKDRSLMENMLYSDIILTEVYRIIDERGDM